MINWKNKKLYKDKNLLDEICVFENYTIKKIIKKINKTALQAVIILDNNRKYKGLITDGDIRRGLIKGFTLNDKVKKILKKNSFYCQDDKTREFALNLMEKKHIMHLPIINKNKNLKGIFYRDELFTYEKNENTILIMAGGYGKRLRPFTLRTPKPMLKINNRPILEHIILKFKREKFKNIIISTHYLGHKIKKYFKNGEKYDLNIKYINEDIPLGTAGSLGLLKQQNNLPIILCNADIITNFNIENMLNYHKKNNAFVTIAVIEYKHQNPFGVIKTKGINLLNIIEKPINRYLINGGMYIFNPDVINLIRKGVKIDMPLVLKKLKKLKKKIIVFPIHERWKDYGRFEDIKNDSKQIHKII